MPTNSINKYIFILISYYISFVRTDTIFDTSQVFYSHFCALGTAQAPFLGQLNQNYQCNTGVAHTGVISSAISYTQSSKPGPQFIQFRATLSAVSSSTYNIAIFQYNPQLGPNKITFFLVLIKAQTTYLLVDLISFTLNSGSNLDNHNNNQRTQNIPVSIPSNSIFSTVPAGLVSIPFTTALQMWPTGFFPNTNDNLQYTLSSSISGTDLIFSLKMQAIGAMPYFKGFAILFNPNAVTAAKANGFYLDGFSSQFSMGTAYTFSTAFSLYGPSYHAKCLFGFTYWKFQGNDPFEFQYVWSGSDYVGIKENDGSSIASKFNGFCFGNNTICTGSTTHKDLLDFQCYIPSACPLPVFTGWNSTDTCPKCTQLICQTCPISNRSQCTGCKLGSHSTLSGTKCVCDAGYVQINLTISTASLGLWNNLSPSLNQCKLNCSAVIPNCQLFDCINSTYCTICIIGFYPKTISATNQNCQLCNVPMPECTNCTVNNICFNCTSLYKINATSNLCICDPVASNLSHCLTCSTPPICTSCDNTSALSNVTNLCVTCDNIHPNCTTCSSVNTCTNCHLTYVLDSLTSVGTIKCILCTTAITGCLPVNCTTQKKCTQCVSGSYVKILNSTDQICDLCSNPIVNCSTCLNNTHCTLCQDGFYLNSTIISSKIICDSCSNPMPQCINCTGANTCINCTVGFKINSLNKCQCDITVNNLTNCLNCTVPTQCHTCANGYYRNSTTKLCQPCSNIHLQCTTCSDENMCTSCNPTYIPDPAAVANKTICTLCRVLIDNCTLCNTTSTCTDCDTYYGLNFNTMECQLCSTLVMEGCGTCQNSTLCITCDNETYQINNTCYYCDRQRYKCVTCNVTAALQLACIQCKPGYNLTFNVYLGYDMCSSCRNVVNFCFQCDSTGCISCIYPYLVGNTTGLCDHCEEGYQYSQGYCLKFPGCYSTVTLNNGTQICIACAIELHFVYSPTLFKCVCDKGYKSFYPIGALMQCVPACGDGILLPQYQACDDNNSINGDGCEDNCVQSPDFQCSGSPSKCVLHFNFDSIVYNYVERVVGQNKGILSYTIAPNHPGLQKIKWDKLIKLNFTNSSVNPSSLQFSYSSLTGQLRIQVPYNEELQNKYVQLKLVFDPAYVMSDPSVLSLTNKLNGINAPLTFDASSLMSNQKTVGILSMVLIVLLILQFYLGSYFHKMIGLQTILVIQIIYFIRMIGTPTSIGILKSLNTIKYSATGYQNSQMIFESSKQLQKLSLKTLSPQFSAINLQKFFLMNVNFFLIPLAITIIVFAISLIRKYRARNNYVSSRQQEQKDKYTIFNRSASWIYDHFVFPYTMMFTPIMFFNTVLYLNSEPYPQTTLDDQIQKLSLPAHLILLFATTAIYCFEIFNSYQDFSKYNKTARQRNRIPQSQFQKIQHDQNNPDRANYHPFYVFVFLFSCLVLWIFMIFPIFMDGFKSFIQLIGALQAFYFILIVIWKPYHESINVHNHFLKLNHGMVVLFIAICLMFDNVKNLDLVIYIACMYIVIVLISLITIGGFIRIYLQKRFRAILEETNMKLFINTQQLEQQQKNKSLEPNLGKRQKLLLNNNYAFPNQLKKMSTKYFNMQELNIPTKNINIASKNIQLTAQVQQTLIKRIRQQYRQKVNKSLLQNYIDKQKDQEIQKQHLKMSNNYGIGEQINKNSMMEEKISQDTSGTLGKSKINRSNEKQKNQLNQIKQKMRRGFHNLK